MVPPYEGPKETRASAPTPKGRELGCAFPCMGTSAYPHPFSPMDMLLARVRAMPPSLLSMHFMSEVILVNMRETSQSDKARAIH